MRDAAIIALIVALSLGALRRPWIGVMLWTWISIMNPHKYGWLSASLPLAALVAGCTLVGVLVTSDRRCNPLDSGPAIVLMLFMGWMSLTLPFSIHPGESFDLWSRVMKIDFMIFVTLMLLQSKRHILIFLWVVVASLAFYGIKGGLFTLATGGGYRVWGPPGSFIEDNNGLALALIMVIPLMRFLQARTSKTWQRHAMTAAMLLVALAALGSQSRGALIGLAAMAALLWWRSANRLVTGAAMSVIIVAALAFMPETWSERMASIGSYQQDASALGRINAWKMAWNLALDRIIGGGFSIYDSTVFAMYAPVADDIHAAHSIYFQVLGEQGFIGLFLFLLLWCLVWRMAGRLRREAAASDETRWVGELAAMCQVSLVGYAVGGAFLSVAYFDLPYDILVVVVLARRWMLTRSTEAEPKAMASGIGAKGSGTAAGEVRPT